MGEIAFLSDPCYGTMSKWNCTMEMVPGDYTVFITRTEAKMIEGVFMFSTEKDPTYSVIVDGEWPNDEPYGVIHRIASSGRVKGVLAKCVEFAKKSADNLRIDTHEENLVMQSALSKLGFEKCGIIFLENGDPRIAFQLIVNK